MSKSRVRVGLIGLLALAFTLTGCIGGLLPKPKPQFGDVAGTVTYEDGTPIADTEVWIGSIVARTSQDGVYVLEEVPYGTHTLQVRDFGDLVHSTTVVVDAASQTKEVSVPQLIALYLNFADAADPVVVEDRVNGLVATAFEFGDTSTRIDGVNPYTGSPAIYFDNPSTSDGNGSYLYVEDDPLLDLSSGNGVTIETFIRPETLKLGVLLRKTMPGSEEGYNLALEAQGRIVMRLQSGSGHTIRTPSNSIVAGEWYHVAGVWDGTRMAIYVNGEEMASADYSAGIGATDGHLGIGSLLRNTGRTSWGQIFHGHMGEVRITNRALTPDEFLGAGSY